MNEEIFAALDQLEKEKGIPKDYMVEKITQALLAAYKKNSTGYTDNVFIDGSGSAMRMYVQKEVVEDVISPATEIELSKAREVEPTCQLGDLVSLEMETGSFSRIAAQTAKQVIILGMREAERGMVFERYNSREHEILTGTVLRIEPQTGDITVRIGTPADPTEALLAAGEQIRGESYHEGDMIRVYVVEVRRSAREAGSRTKLAVWAADPAMDPVGACVGPRGGRVGAVVEELHGEKMDIVRFYEEPEKFIAQALSPADVISVVCQKGTKACRVIVPDDQLSLAIGKEGQNARLAARLTGYKIDIKSANAPDDGLFPVEPEEPEEAPEEETAAE